MNYLRFFLNNKRIISFGFFLTFFSSFGQTFLVSLYVPAILKEFDLTKGSFGTLYGAATILSGFSLVYFGKFVDKCNLRNYTLTAVILLILSCFCISFAPGLIWILLGFWGLRFAGQGLLSHISSTSMSKFFDKKRGTALSLSVMGFSLGEACLPFIIALIIGWIGWRYSMFLNGLLITVTLLPFIFISLNKQGYSLETESQSARQKKDFSRLALWKDKRFIIIITAVFILPFMITGLFFHQLSLVTEKGWSVEWLTASFLGFALGRSLLSLISGKLIDKFSAVKIFPYHLCPFLVALSVLILFDHPFAAPVYLILTGVTMGMSSTTITAVLAEIYGTNNLGSIRAMAMTVMVFSTALSPALFGLALDNDFSFRSIIIASSCIVALIIFISRRLQYYVNSSEEIEAAEKMCYNTKSSSAKG